MGNSGDNSIMYITFRTIENDMGAKRDEYSIHETDGQAEWQYIEWLKDKLTYCAGYGAIKNGSEPHWIGE